MSNSKPCTHGNFFSYSHFMLRPKAFILKSGDVPRVDGQLAVARAFGDKSIKVHLSSEPDVAMEKIDDDTEFAILASDGLWKVSDLDKSELTTLLAYDCAFSHSYCFFPPKQWQVMTNQEAVDSARHVIKDARSAAKHLTEEALARGSTDDISVIVVKF